MTIGEIKRESKSERKAKCQAGMGGEGNKNSFSCLCVYRSIFFATSPATCKCVVLRKDITLPLYQQQTGCFPLISILVTAVFCLARLSLGTGHCTSSFISRPFPTLLLLRSETNFFYLSVCLPSFLWLSIFLFVGPPMCHSFPFRIVILLPISVAISPALSLKP